MNILFVSSEAAPFAKTGGLADVAGSLPAVLKGLGADIRLVIPKYKNISEEYTKAMEFLGSIYVDIGWRRQYCGIFKLTYNGFDTYFIDNEYYFFRNGLYGEGDEGERFSFFCNAVVQMLPFIGFKADIIHCNDWQSGAIPLLLKAKYIKQEFYSNIKSIFTIHNLKYQGVFPKIVLTELLGVDEQYFGSIEFFGNMSFMKAGLEYSDLITTVSPTYADEIMTEYYGENLDGILRRRSSDLYGILNGINAEENNPLKDNRLYAKYSAHRLKNKYINKSSLQNDLNLPQRHEVPLIAIISRLVDQKGFDLIAFVLEELLAEDIQLVVLGTGDKAYEDLFKSAAQKYPDKVSANIKYDSILAQRIYAGSDMFLMPSMFEPCGLGQLYSLRYGSVPIVRETGGLNDTVKSYNELTGEGNGFSFSNYNAHDMLNTIKRALAFYRNTDVWKKIVRYGMKQDFSWSRSADEYIKLYEKLTPG